MTNPTTKAELLHEVQKGYTAFEALLAPLSEAQLTTPGVSDAWSIKDILVHLATWQGRAADILEAAGRDEKPQLEPPVTNNEEMDRFNDATFAANRERPLEQVWSDVRASYQRLLAATEALSEADLFSTERFAWMKENALWQTVEGDTFGHYTEHAPVIAAWLAKG